MITFAVSIPRNLDFLPSARPGPRATARSRRTPELCGLTLPCGLSPCLVIEALLAEQEAGDCPGAFRTGDCDVSPFRHDD